MRHSLIIIAFSCLALPGCSGDQHSDLQKFVKDSDNMPRGRIEPLPDVKDYVPIAYKASDDKLDDPFQARDVTPPAPPKRDPKDPRFDPTRKKGPLEAFPLESLQMVGTLQQKKDMFALIRTPDRNLYRVKTGDFIGQNTGRITGIDEAKVTLTELIQDGGSDWREEQRTLLLQE